MSTYNEIKAYSGNKPYIFVSYAHKDSEVVLPIIEKLQKKGFRIWFDKGIEAGSEWPQYIAEHLNDSCCVLVFMSHSAADSHNCRREINFAIELNKELLVIYLEDFEMNLGMRMQLNSLQAIYKYRFNKLDSFIEELSCAKIIQNCREIEVADETIVKTKTYNENIQKSKNVISFEQSVVGIVIGFTNTEIIVEIVGRKQIGYVPFNEYSDDPTVDPKAELMVGDEIELRIMKINDDEGSIKLSKHFL